ncbi:MAG: bifunctional MaoC family dehydratase N-terminal/OB-fold nucleic acid binding domain-containing protein [Nocardioides sp.]
MTHDEIMAAAERIKANGETSPRLGRDPVNQPMINNWVEAIGDLNPRWRTGEAPWAMAQVWTMGGLHPQRDPDDPLHSMMTVLTDAGFTGVLGTNCEQEYARPLRVGEEVTVTTRLESVVGPKQTGVGEGYFVTTRNVWRVGDEEVASMMFRVLKFVPRQTGASAEADFVLRPQMNRDTEFFWEGTRAGELRIQTCNVCGALRHPPGPACPACGALDRGYVVASGRGTVFSYVVHRHPPVPGRELPILLVLVDLEEGVRMLGELLDTDPEKVEIGMPVVVDFQRIDDDLTLPVWRQG